jgi:hypothetical protein
MDDLVAALKNGTAILFAGAGLSVGLGAPTFAGLVAKMADDLGYDPSIFSANGASAWTLAEYYKLTKGTIGPLRSWMDKAWNAPEDAIMNSKPHELISKLGFESIYTTNYDSNIERSLTLHGIEFSKIANVRDFKTARNVLHVIKLHGDFDDDNSIVLAESDYFSRLNFDSPLDVRLRSDAIGKTILFVGYSLNDFNVRYLLFKLWQTWQHSHYPKDRPKSYIFLARPDAINEAVLRNWGVEPITAESDSPGEALVEFLTALEKTVSLGSASPGPA